MTTVFPETVKCSVCGAENEIMVIGSTNAFGAPDLDTRPPEMKRSTMGYWVQECKTCGYTAVDLTDETKLDRAFFKEKDYKTCNGIPFGSGLAKTFYRYYLIMTAEGEHEGAFFAALHAAWACDDARDEANAALMREKAMEQADQVLVSDSCDWKDTLRLIRADLLRRTGHFDKLLQEYRPGMFGEDLLNRIITFELELAKRERTQCFTVEDSEQYAAGTFVWPEK